MILLRSILGLTMAFFIVQIKLDYFEGFLYDVHFRLRPSPDPSGAVSLIMMDPDTVTKTHGIPSYKDHTAVLKKVIRAKPRAIVYVTPLVQFGESEAEIERAQASPSGTFEDQIEFVRTLSSFEDIYQLTDQTTLKGEEDKLILHSPFENVKVLSAPKTRDTELFANDGVTRRVLVDYGREPLGHLKLAQLIRPELDRSDPLRGTFELYETRQLWIDFSRNLPTTIKFEEILEADSAALNVRGQIVVIGDNFSRSLRNSISTPFSRDPASMPYLDMHANMLETFIRNSAPIPAPQWLHYLLTAIISILTIHAVLNMRPLQGLLVLGFGALATFVFSTAMFWPFGIWVQVAHPFLAIFICYYFFIPYRLIVENRKSWEYYQKHQLLQQVETLKTNFISMMSHDLKTPIARIQGMTDVIMKDDVVLSSSQREALDHIRNSGDDLLRFISSILDYAKIESEGVRLKTESRDVNEILREVVKKYEFMAKVKNIQLVTELEPLFSIPVDPDLISQVFSNLIENSIKYSPEHSKVLISTEETEGFVIIEIADQGQGIADAELSNIFMKFFRSANAKASPIKGSGLGLYLAKYFVELHHGRIEVESIKGLGSTFTVELPIHPPEAPPTPH